MSQPFAIVSDTGHNLPLVIVQGMDLHEVSFSINLGVRGSADDGVLKLERTVEARIGPSILIHTGKRAVGVVWEERGWGDAAPAV